MVFRSIPIKSEPPRRTANLRLDTLEVWAVALHCGRGLIIRGLLCDPLSQDEMAEFIKGLQNLS